ncbi:MAG TPA: hypothetical protein DHV48_09965 [Prolixibacteraceae bacterium]|nr:MAG: hypothetical protein A2066_04430 [Bacteroidetes bacterium GWB2_41_8]HCY41664.1 hypothetical protein [Prolixibacteraceae bacterium]
MRIFTTFYLLNKQKAGKSFLFSSCEFLFLSRCSNAIHLTMIKAASEEDAPNWWLFLKVSPGSTEVKPGLKTCKK